MQKSRNISVSWKDGVHLFYQHSRGIMLQTTIKIITTLTGSSALCIAFISATMAAGIMEVFPLKYRSAEEVIPAIQPFLDRDSAISNMQGKLIIRTSPGNMQEIRRLLDTIDTAPRRLMITVRQDVDRATERRLRELSGQAGSEDAHVVISSNAGSSSGVIMQGQQGDTHLRAQVINSRSLENDKNTQRLQVLEGNRAFIRVGQSLPIPTRGVIYSPQGVRVIENTQFRDATVGFSVLPRLNGDRVTIEVSPQRDSPNMQMPDTINIQQIVTSVSGKLGEWIDIGGTGQSGHNQASTLNSRSIMNVGDQRTVLIRVEELR